MTGIPLSRRAQRLLALGGRDDATSGSPPEPARAAALEALARGETHYTDRPGILPLRRRVSAWLERDFGIVSDPERDVVITCGATEARFVAIQTLLEPGETLLGLGNNERVAGALIVRGCVLLEAEPAPSEQALEGVAALYLDADSAASGAGRRWLELAQARGWWVILELPTDARTEHPAIHPDLVGRTVTVGDIGVEAGAASWRVGYLVAPTEPAAALRSFKQALTICTTSLSQWGAVELFEAEA